MRKWFSILIAGLLATGLCWEWYSVQFFRKAWLAGQWITSRKIDAQMQAGLGWTWFFTACAFIVLSLGVHYFLAATGCATFLQIIGTAFVLWCLVALPLLFLDFLWEFRRHDLLCLDGLFLLIVFMLIACVNFLIVAHPKNRRLPSSPLYPHRKP